VQTEELVRREQPHDVHGVSPALLELAAPAWQLVNDKGKPVPLSSAGYVLHFGKTYRIRLTALSEEGAPPNVRLISVPPFVQRFVGEAEAAKHGQSTGSVSFRVQSEWLRLMKVLAGIRYGDLEIECTSGEPPQRIEFVCPVVARVRWGLGIVLSLALWALLGLLYGRLESLGKQLLAQGPAQVSNVDNWWAVLPPDLRIWLWLLGLAALYPLATLGWHIYSLRRRSAELEARYQRRLTTIL
jgi:hypothetical protein